MLAITHANAHTSLLTCRLKSKPSQMVTPMAGRSQQHTPSLRAPPPLPSRLPPPTSTPLHPRRRPIPRQLALSWSTRPPLLHTIQVPVLLLSRRPPHLVNLLDLRHQSLWCTVLSLQRTTAPHHLALSLLLSKALLQVRLPCPATLTMSHLVTMHNLQCRGNLEAVF